MTFALAPRKLNYCASTIVAGNRLKPTSVVYGWWPGRTSFNLHQYQIEEITSLEDVPFGLYRILSYRHEVNYTAPLALPRAPERNKLPPLRNACAQCAKHDFRQAPSRVSL